MSNPCPVCERREPVMEELVAVCQELEGLVSHEMGYHADAQLVDDDSPEGTVLRARAAIAKAKPPCDHEVVAESGPHVHCTKCQRSGRRVDGMIRWSD